MKKFLCLFVVLTLACWPVAGFAQRIESPSRTVPHIAVLPLQFFEGDSPCDNKTATGAVMDDLAAILNKLAIDQVDTPHTLQAWKNVTGYGYSASTNQLPDPQQLMKLGHELGVEYVMFGRIKYHISTPWQGLGPKTHADATIDLWIVDTRKSEFSLKVEAIKAGDTEREPGWKTAAAILVAPVISFASGGPKTPHMVNAGVTAFDKAIGPWYERLSSNEKIR